MGCQQAKPVRFPLPPLPSATMLPEKQPCTLHSHYDSHHHISFITVTPNSAQHIRKKVRDMKGKEK